MSDRESRRLAAVILAIPSAVLIGMWQSSWLAGIAAHTVLYVLYCIELHVAARTS